MKFSKSINERAWRLKRKGYSWSESMKLAMDAEKVIAAMREGLVLVRFEKVNGEVTERWATLLPAYIGGEFKGSSRKRVSEKVSFYSVKDGGFRSFLPQNLISWAKMGEANIEVKETAADYTYLVEIIDDLKKAA